MRRCLLVFLSLILLFALAGSGSAAENRISSLTQEITVDDDGAAFVKVTAVVEFASAPETFLFPLNSSASGVNASGGEYSSTSVNGVSCIRFKNSNGFVGTQTDRFVVRRKNGGKRIGVERVAHEGAFIYILQIVQLTDQLGNSRGCALPFALGDLRRGRAGFFGGRFAAGA